MDFKFPLTLGTAGALVTVDDVDETAQRARIALKSGQGEWPFDLSYGVPWRQIMATRPYDLGVARAAVVQALRRVPGLDSVDSVDFLVNEVARTASVVVVVTASGVSVEVSS